jgi:hypothetical protein
VSGIRKFKGMVDSVSALDEKRRLDSWAKVGYVSYAIVSVYTFLKVIRSSCLGLKQRRDFL